MPLNQLDPDSKTHLISVTDPFIFLNIVKYCVNYPDLMCYERHGNGWTSGDSDAWTVSSCSDHAGLGSVRIRFPIPTDGQSAGDVNGLHHPRNNGKVLGFHTTLGCLNGYVRFHPGATIDFYAFTPFERSSGALFVTFSGPANSCFDFAFIRRVVWLGSPPPYVPPENDPEHDEL